MMGMVTKDHAESYYATLFDTLTKYYRSSSRKGNDVPMQSRCPVCDSKLRNVGVDPGEIESPPQITFQGQLVNWTQAQVCACGLWAYYWYSEVGSRTRVGLTEFHVIRGEQVESKVKEIEKGIETTEAEWRALYHDPDFWPMYEAGWKLRDLKGRTGVMTVPRECVMDHTDLGMFADWIEEADRPYPMVLSAIREVQKKLAGG